jgi:tetratricopeptide (TPR) repeat protein
MKKIVCAILGVAVVGSGIAMYASRSTKPAVSPAPHQSASAPNQVLEKEPTAPPAAAIVPAQPISADSADSNPVLTTVASAPTAKAIDPDVKRVIDSLLSAKLTHEQRRDALKKLVESGKIDQAIGELEQQAANNPDNAEYQTALGQAYLEKGVALQDNFTDKALLVMQAVKSFDAALSDDPANWEARFTRTAIMSHYPAEANKGQEVIDQFSQLIDQQEKQTPQPQFAKTYVLLGDQYQKLGNNDYAVATWQAGTALFPNDSTLQKRLAGQ